MVEHEKEASDQRSNLLENWERGQHCRQLTFGKLKETDYHSLVLTFSHSAGHVDPGIPIKGQH